MPHHTKIATCCYCGTRAALVLKGSERHELSCAACGAPLHDMKMLRTQATKSHPIERNPKPKKRSKGVTPNALWERELKRGKKKKKSKKSFARRIFSEAFDVLEDIFD
ncbi:hypothetical protein [Primorskyibacter sp. S187A]|uniref:hypothetical protein n=1 Tax=Primorskyibacter sp. S187A TaxID=3415130 RepID=UPI003C7AE378